MIRPLHVANTSTSTNLLEPGDKDTISITFYNQFTHCTKCSDSHWPHPHWFVDKMNDIGMVINRMHDLSLSIPNGEILDPHQVKKSSDGEPSTTCSVLKHGIAFLARPFDRVHNAAATTSAVRTIEMTTPPPPICPVRKVTTPAEVVDKSTLFNGSKVGLLVSSSCACSCHICMPAKRSMTFHEAANMAQDFSDSLTYLTVQGTSQRTG